MRFVGQRRSRVIIEEWRRRIGDGSYKFNVTKWPDSNEAVFTVSKRKLGASYLEIHCWRVKGNQISGTYRRR